MSRMSRVEHLTELLESCAEKYREVHGFEWNYVGGKIRRQNTTYFLILPGKAEHLGTFTNAVNHLLDYVQMGRPNAAMRRAGVKHE